MTDTEELRRITPAELSPPGVAVTARTFKAAISNADAEFCGVTVTWHPGIPRYMRRIALEAVVRHWQGNVGSVKRGMTPDNGMERLPGWRLMLPGEGPVRELELAWREGE